jgi:hypothetical protein
VDGSLALPYTVTAEQPQNGTGRQEVETTLENLQVVAALVGCDYGSVRGFGPVKAFKALQDAGDGGSERLLALVKERVAKEEDAACINAVLHQFQRARTNGFDEFSLTPLPAPEGTLSAAVKINETNMGYLIQLLYVAEHPEIANSWIQGSPLLPAVPPELPVPCKLVLTPSDIQDSDIPGVWSDDVCAWPITRKKRLLKIYSVRTAWGVGWTHAQVNRDLRHLIENPPGPTRKIVDPDDRQNWDRKTRALFDTSAYSECGRMDIFIPRMIPTGEAEWIDALKLENRKEVGRLLVESGFVYHTLYDSFRQSLPSLGNRQVLVYALAFSGVQ